MEISILLGASLFISAIANLSYLDLLLGKQKI